MKVLIFAVTYAAIAVAVAATGVAMAEKKSPSANSISGWLIVGLLWPITSLTLMANCKEICHE